MIKNLYLALSQKLATITEIKSIDLFRNQFSTWKDETVYEFPVCFLEFDCDFENRTQNTQKGNARIKVHIATSFNGDSREGSSTQNTALECFDVAQLVHETLQGFGEGFFSSLNRTGLGQDTSPNSIYTIVQSYECEFIDTSTSIAKDRIEANPDIKLKSDNGEWIIENPNN